MNGASVSLDFWGTGVTVYGSSSPGAFVTSIDSKDTPGAPKDTKLFATDSLPLGKHTMVCLTKNYYTCADSLSPN